MIKEYVVTLTRPQPMMTGTSDRLRADAMAWCEREGIPFLEGRLDPDEQSPWVIYTETTPEDVYLIHFRFFNEDQAFAFKMRWQ